MADKISIRLEDELAQLLRVYAKVNGHSITYVVSKALGRFIPGEADVMTPIMPASGCCIDRNHVGIERVMQGARLPDDSLGQNAAFIAMILGKLEAENNELRGRLGEALIVHSGKAPLDRVAGKVRFNEGFISPSKPTPVESYPEMITHPPTKEALEAVVNAKLPTAVPKAVPKHKPNAKAIKPVCGGCGGSGYDEEAHTTCSYCHGEPPEGWGA